jgi:hypothetical protein
MTLKNALLSAKDLTHPGQVLLGTLGGFVIQGDLIGPVDDDAEVIAFDVAAEGRGGSVERGNGSAIRIPTGRLIIPIRNIAWISQAGLSQE